MAQRLTWSETALLTKKEIFDYWNEAAGSKKYSITLEKEIVKITDTLLLFPLLGREIDNYDARIIIKGHYSIIYKLIRSESVTEIRILHVWDTRRDPDKLKL